MTLVIIVPLCICVLGMAFCMFMNYRNNWVHDNLLELLYSDFESFKKTESYSRIMWRFWVWDIKKFIKR